MLNRPERTGAVTYEPTELRRIVNSSDRNALGKRLPYKTIFNVRQLKIYKRKCGTRGGIRSRIPDRIRGIEVSNLVSIQIGCIQKSMSGSTRSLTIGTVNCRSLKPKVELVHNLIKEDKIDILL